MDDPKKLPGPNTPLDREALRARMSEQSTTWRWNDGGVEGYLGVELRGQHLRWFRWSHAPESGGAHDEVEQKIGSFLETGPPTFDPPRFVPPPILDAIRAACG